MDRALRKLLERLSNLGRYVVNDVAHDVIEVLEVRIERSAVNMGFLAQFRYRDATVTMRFKEGDQGIFYRLFGPLGAGISMMAHRQPF